MRINSSQNETYTILDLPKIIKIAREHALLGCYETSIKKYQIALEIIQSRKKEVNVGVLREKWQMTELNIKSEISQTKQMLDACKTLTNIDFDYFKKQLESNEIKRKKLQEKGIMVFDMSNNNRSSGPNQNYFGSAPFSFKDPSKQDPFSDFNKDPINGIMTDTINSDVNEDDEKILNPLIPQKKFGNKNKNRNKKKLGKITAINVIQNNTSNKNITEKKENPWFKHDKSKSDNISNFSKKTEEKSFLNPLEQFDISKTDTGLDATMSVNNTTFDNNTTFINEIKSFIDKNKKNSYAENAKKRKNMGYANVSRNNLNNPQYPIGVGNYSNKNKMINFDKKTANKGALPVIMKKENQKIINNKQQQEQEDKKEIDLINQTNNNDISAVKMIDEALNNFKNIDDDSSIMDVSKISKWMK